MGGGGRGGAAVICSCLCGDPLCGRGEGVTLNHITDNEGLIHIQGVLMC